MSSPFLRYDLRKTCVRCSRLPLLISNDRSPGSSFVRAWVCCVRVEWTVKTSPVRHSRCQQQQHQLSNPICARSLHIWCTTLGIRLANTCFCFDFYYSISANWWLAWKYFVVVEKIILGKNTSDNKSYLWILNAKWAHSNTSFRS